MIRRFILQILVPAMTAAAVVAPGASAMPMRDVNSAVGAHDASPAALVDAAAHAATMRRIGARLTARPCA